MKRPKSRFANSTGANLCIIIGAAGAVIGLVAGIANLMPVAQIGFLLAPLIGIGVIGLYIDGVMKKIDLRLIDIQMVLQHGHPRPDDTEPAGSNSISGLKGRYKAPEAPLSVDAMNDAVAEMASDMGRMPSK